jgi:uroporphyrinogen decarboxylase
MPSTLKTHRMRLETCLSGQKPDRVPVALWRHFPVDDQNPLRLAAAISNFQQMYDFDFIKVTPASSFATKDWGTQDKWTGNPEGTRDYQDPVINRFDDWRSLSKLDPRKGFLGQMLETLTILAKEYSPNVPFIQTIFSPLSQAKNLVGKERLYHHMRACPEALHLGLRTITDVTIDFLREARKTGIDGVFYAIQHAQYQLLSSTEFESFGRFYDLQVLEAAKDLWLNVGHIHGENIMFDQVRDYPVSILNWHDRHTSPTLAEALHRYSGAVCGGLRQWETLILSDPEHVTHEALEAIQQTQGKRFILGTGCVIPITAPHGNIQAARQAVEK